MILGILEGLIASAVVIGFFLRRVSDYKACSMFLRTKTKPLPAYADRGFGI